MHHVRIVAIRQASFWDYKSNTSEYVPFFVLVSLALLNEEDASSTVWTMSTS